MEKIKNSFSKYGPGIVIAFIVAFAAKFLGEHYGAPTMLFALLLGMALNFLSEDNVVRPGIDYTATKILRIGIALLGVRIAFSDLTAFGWKPVALVIIGVITTIGIGMIIARMMGYKYRFGTLTGGAVAICGASAAMAISAVLPTTDKQERDTVFTVVAVTTLSTLAMILYPLITQAIEMNDLEAGLFFGATIHDVAQVIGAGATISDEALNIATMTKLMRVALLVPVVLLIALSFRKDSKESSDKPPALPFFLVMFLVMVGLNSMGWIPELARDYMIEGSKLFLIAAISAVGLKTNLKSIAEVGFKPVALMLIETIWIGGLVLVALPYVV